MVTSARGATAGVDVGSLTAKAVIFDPRARRVLGVSLVETGAAPERAGRTALDEALRDATMSPGELAAIVGTGYGRVSLDFVTRCVTEITCHACGVHFLLPTVRTLIDVGGQDSKVIQIDAAGRALDFEMNDRCAAGTGRFLQVMAHALGTDLPGLVRLARQAREPVRLSSTCTVFAESEVVGLLAQGRSSADVAAGLCQAVAQRVAGMVGRLGVRPPVAFTGGVALNEAVREALAGLLGQDLAVPAMPQYTGALGAALLASRPDHRAALADRDE